MTHRVIAIEYGAGRFAKVVSTFAWPALRCHDLERVVFGIVGEGAGQKSGMQNSGIGFLQIAVTNQRA
jgi:hypothetical protein